MGTAAKLAIDPKTQPESNCAAEASSATLVETSAPADSVGMARCALDSETERIKIALEKKRKMFLVTALEGARLARVEGNELYIEFAPEAKHLRDTLAKSDNVKVIREVCQEATGKEMGVRIAIKNQNTNNALPLSKEEEERREKQRLREVAEQDPVVQQLLRTFRGEIVYVRRIDSRESEGESL